MYFVTEQYYKHQGLRTTTWDTFEDMMKYFQKEYPDSDFSEVETEKDLGIVVDDGQERLCNERGWGVSIIVKIESKDQVLQGLDCYKD